MAALSTAPMFHVSLASLWTSGPQWDCSLASSALSLSLVIRAIKREWPPPAVLSIPRPGGLALVVGNYIVCVSNSADAWVRQQTGWCLLTNLMRNEENLKGYLFKLLNLCPLAVWDPIVNASLFEVCTVLHRGVTIGFSDDDTASWPSPCPPSAYRWDFLSAVLFVPSLLLAEPDFIIRITLPWHFLPSHGPWAWCSLVHFYKTPCRSFLIDVLHKLCLLEPYLLTMQLKHIHLCIQWGCSWMNPLGDGLHVPRVLLCNGGVFKGGVFGIASIGVCHCE